MLNQINPHNLRKLRGNQERELVLPAPKRRQSLLVLGMHRSGTSMLARVISIAGAQLPRRLMGSGTGNESGHWEPSVLVDYHDGLLNELGSRWDDWRQLECWRLPDGRREQIITKIAALLTAEYGDADPIVVKDPRICRFTSLFLQASAEADLETHAVVIVRNPLEVCKSLQKRDGMPLGQAGLLWLRHMLDAESATRHCGRTILPYHLLVADWRAAMERLVANLPTPLPHAVEGIAGQIEAFLTPNRRHHVHSTEDVLLEPALRDWIGEAYESLLVLAADPASKPAADTLDRIRREFDHAAPVFVRLIEEHRIRTEIEISRLRSALAVCEVELAAARHVAPRASRLSSKGRSAAKWIKAHFERTSR